MKTIKEHADESKTVWENNQTSKLFILACHKEFMGDDSDDLKKSAREKSDKLARLGTELGEIRFSYRIKEKPTQEYWKKRIKDFKKYSDKGLEYYNHVYSLMKTVDKEEAQLFLLRVGKFRQMGLELIKIMEKIRENPTIMDKKDRQQSQWSKEIKANITEHSNKCLRHEMDMNASFREFYEKNLKKGVLG